MSAAGFAIPPMVVQDWKTLHQDMSSVEVPCTLHAMTHIVDGWTKICLKPGYVVILRGMLLLCILCYTHNGWP